MDSDPSRPILEKLKNLLIELDRKPRSFQASLGAIVGFAIAFPTIQLVKNIAFTLGVIVLGLSSMNKFVLDVSILPVPGSNIYFDHFKAVVVEYAIFCTGFVAGYLIGMKFA